MPTVHGRAYINVDGTRYNTQAGATLKLSGDALTPVVGDSGLAGSQAEYQAGEVTCTIIATADISTEALKGQTDVSITFESDNGKSWIASNAFRGPLPQLAKEGYAMTYYGDFKEA